MSIYVRWMRNFYDGMKIIDESFFIHFYCSAFCVIKMYCCAFINPLVYTEKRDFVASFLHFKTLGWVISLNKHSNLNDNFSVENSFQYLWFQFHKQLSSVAIVKSFTKINNNKNIQNIIYNKWLAVHNVCIYVNCDLFITIIVCLFLIFKTNFITTLQTKGGA